MRHKPQFDLRIVGADQLTAGRGDEHAPDLFAALLAYGDVLQIGLGRRQSARSGDRLTEHRVYPSLGVYQRQHAVEIGGFEFGKFTVGQDKRNDRVLVFECREHFNVGRIAALCLFARFQSEFFEQNVRELFGGIEVERLACKLRYPCGQLVQLCSESLCKRIQRTLVDGESPVFHIFEH